MNPKKPPGSCWADDEFYGWLDRAEREADGIARASVSDSFRAWAAIAEYDAKLALPIAALDAAGPPTGVCGETRSTAGRNTFAVRRADGQGTVEVHYIESEERLEVVAIDVSAAHALRISGPEGQAVELEKVPGTPDAWTCRLPRAEIRIPIVAAIQKGSARLEVDR